MFTLEQIKAAHSKVKSGADFPKYIQDLGNLSVICYYTYVVDGHTEYFGPNNYQVNSDTKYPVLNISEKNDLKTFVNRLKAHQQGQTDYMTFCNDAANTGVEKWVVDIKKMTCIYYGLSKNIMLEEKIPTI